MVGGQTSSTRPNALPIWLGMTSPLTRAACKTAWSTSSGLEARSSCLCDERDSLKATKARHACRMPMLMSLGSRGTPSGSCDNLMLSMYSVKSKIQLMMPFSVIGRRSCFLQATEIWTLKWPESSHGSSHINLTAPKSAARVMPSNIKGLLSEMLREPRWSLSPMSPRPIQRVRFHALIARVVLPVLLEEVVYMRENSLYQPKGSSFRSLLLVSSCRLDQIASG